MDDNNMALIIFSGVNLLLPQSSVVKIDTIENIVNEIPVAGAIGMLKTSATEWPVFALDANFRPLSACPSGHKYCVAIGQTGKAAFSIACEEVGAVVVEHKSDLTPLQPCMRSAVNPIASLIFKNEKLMLVSDIESMQNYFNLGAAA